MFKVFISDLDGTLTDGGYYVSNNDSIMKKFHTRDFWGLENLVKRGIRCHIVTASIDTTIDTKLKTFKFDLKVHKHVLNKKLFVSENMLEDGILKKFIRPWTDVAYIGDDIGDLELLSIVGLAACPRDAHPSVKKLIENRPDAWVMEHNGGDGCVREFIDLISERK